MRRSLAPSQRRLSNEQKTKINTNNINKPGDKDGDIVIERLPLFGFLSIPENLNKKFRVPSGCEITPA